MNIDQTNTSYFNVAHGVWGLKDIFVNIYMIQNEDEKSWVLVDAGLKTGFHKIQKMAADLFGEESVPSAIILTHGHFDHVGSLFDLAALWKVPIYAHFLEFPYLTGRSSYPPADPSVGGGLMAFMADLYPNDPIDVEEYLLHLPEDYTLPGLPDWRYLHTPGHAPGHVSFWREKDKTLIAGDAFVTTKQESALSVMLQSKIISGPPKYFTYDWKKSEESVKSLVALQPETIATGHGQPMNGEEMLDELTELKENFKQQAVPKHGRYVNEPAVANADGIIYVPPKNKNAATPLIVIGLVISVAAFSWILLAGKIKKDNILPVSIS
jgi:glyoxylase-like metal-dependent hydrolase (beta-lactamase superfamily II)